MLCQRTLKTAVETSGIGLHCAEPVRLCLRPAPVDTGIVFRRTDLHPAVDIPATLEHVAQTTLSTSLARDGQHLATVEHLLAALSGLGVDNAVVEVTARELPIMDGSAGPFVSLIESAGVVEQSAPRLYLRIKREVRVAQGDKWALFQPFAGFRVAFSIDYDQPVLQEQVVQAEIDFSRASFADDVSQARTFGFMRDIDLLRSRGFALGGSLDNAVVLDDHRVLNREGLRSQDELVKHKVLDAIGDLYLFGHPIIGEFRAHKSGHTLNNVAMHALLDATDAWELVPSADPRPLLHRDLSGAL
ncbi:MAG: UDP-3-O-acyl-N-acetylglucosamine deacetylase [Gammaproteobacteria bacterium]|nr:UDP-3-O-acyl-N-acetylglucosamine deacetylase [Gammaproteobacteria bacterium]